MKLKIKIITGFREDQSYSIDADEAHKAYYLFLNPEKRGVFSNGVALMGKDIRGIQPDYNATFDYNPDYKLDADDWNEVRRTGVSRRMGEVLESAKLIAQMEKMELMNLPLSEAIKALPSREDRKEIDGMVKTLAEGMKI